MATTVDLTEIGYRVLNVTGVKGFQLKPVSGEEFAYHLIVFTPSIEWVTVIMEQIERATTGITIQELTFNFQ